MTTPQSPSPPDGTTPSFGDSLRAVPAIQLVAAAGTALAVIIVLIWLVGDSEGGGDSPIDILAEQDPTAFEAIVQASSAFDVGPIESEPATSSLEVVQDYTIELADGSNLRAVIEIGAVQRIGAGSGGWDVFAGRCAFDLTRDAYVPFRVLLTNTTDGFPVETSFHLTFGQREGAGAPQRILYLGDNSGCLHEVTPVEPEQTVETTIFETLQPGDSRLRQGGLVLVNFFTPNTPAGNYELFNRLEWASTHPSGEDNVEQRSGRIKLS